MNAVKPSFIAVLAALFSGSSLAEPYDSNKGLAAPLLRGGSQLRLCRTRKPCLPIWWQKKC